uniref:NADH-ubiquinone oxidoreductase chain 6 n=1 Tax=Oscaecilia ochrocephala TaxID=543905 RepID=C9D8K9_OSCOC|nr:NADH dehydrogenase subunit 6 [Oscaecilia ochrocephala]ACS37142.1 NADH dehydrogenase subunit 6 [Oscaecilia ochrocephala]
MSYVLFFGLVGVILGLVGVASNPSPYFAAFGLVVGAALGCLVLMGLGLGFLSLVLFLIYLGGMLVVFAYSTAMAAESYPAAWGDWSVVSYVLGYLVVLVVGAFVVEGGGVVFSLGEFTLVCCDWGGVSVLYYVGNKMLLVLGWVLLLTLFVVLEITRVVAVGAMNEVKL